MIKYHMFRNRKQPGHTSRWILTSAAVILLAALLSACGQVFVRETADNPEPETGPGIQWTGLEWDGSASGNIGQRNCDIVSLGRECARTDSIPYDSMAQAAQAARNYQKELSPYYLLLSQTNWKFTLYDSPSEFDSGNDTGFYQPEFDDSGWEEIFVPSVWQTQGYDHPAYRNIAQNFAGNFGNDDIGNPQDLPRAPAVYNPVGLYRHLFEVPQEWEGSRVYLDFEGVDAAFYVWINGIQTGYAEDSFTTDEFDITDYVKYGQENTIAIKVFRWCDGSWLEDQDFIDLSGIFGDVYLYAAPQVRVRDFSIVTDFDGTFTDSILQAEVFLHNYTALQQNARIGLYLLDADGRDVEVENPEENCRQDLSLDPGTEKAISFQIPVEQPRKWSGEDPYLYTLVIEEQTDAGTVYESVQVGFRKITYKTTSSGWYEGATDDQDLICINGQPISFRGVDRHETHPEYGYALTRDVMEEDIRIMLENQINAVRTSHYPNHPYWYYLCDKYGIYVLDEANLECHSNMWEENERITEYLCSAVIDREYNMIRRDRNHASVVMWSLGNECGNPDILRTLLVQDYPDPEGTSRILHEYTKDRPWHYEQAGEGYETGIDVYSRMYARPQTIADYGENDAAAPMIECEYEHAMGNSEGNFDEYWEAFDTYRNLQGGFIWDFVDQSLYVETEDGTRCFGYGGDFGEQLHDDNFCANGLLLPDRTLQPEMAEVRYHYQQIKFTDIDASHGRVEIRNYFLFTDIREKYDIYWSLQEDDVVIVQGVLDLSGLEIPCVDPLTSQPGTAEVFVPFPEDVAGIEGREYFLNLSVRLKEDSGLLPAGYEIAREQFPVILESFAAAETDRGSEDPMQAQKQEVHWNIRDAQISVETDTLRLVFDQNEGRLIRFQTQAEEDGEKWTDLLEPKEGPRGNFFRGSTDNDRSSGAGQSVWMEPWKEPGDYMVTDVTVREPGDETVIVRIEGNYPDLNQTKLNIEYTVYPEGFAAVDVSILPEYQEELPYLPVAGISMLVPEDYEQLSWFGNGPEETYIDRYQGTSVGKWSSTVSENFFPYVQSSETGNHIKTRWVALTDASGAGLLAVAAADPFEFSALHYTARELDRAVHPYELHALSQTVLRIHAVQMGVGGDDSWSFQVTHEEYLPKDSGYSFTFLLGPVSSVDNAMALAGIWRQTAASR